MKLQKLGIEIRKIGDVSSLYNDVDNILRVNSIPDGGITYSIQRDTVAHTLQNMLKPDRYFDNCTLRACAELCHITIPYDRMQVYHTIHCTYWNEMLPNYRNSLVAMILDDFRSVLNP